MLPSHGKISGASAIATSAGVHSRELEASVTVSADRATVPGNQNKKATSVSSACSTSSAAASAAAAAATGGRGGAVDPLALSWTLPLVTKAEGHFIYLDDGRKVLDACGGAAVACLGHGNREVVEAIIRQAQMAAYVPWAFFDSQVTRDLSESLVQSTNGAMAKIYLTSSGSEAVDGAMKLAREFFVWTGEPQRINFIARKDSYHGTTLGTLSLGGHVGRRAPFEPLLLEDSAASSGTGRSVVEHVSSCNSYRQKLPNESDAQFVVRKAAELEEAFVRLGSHTVCAFVAEPVVGAAAGCLPAVPGYLAAMKAVCRKYGALFILDEVMCGMGRTGTLHAWQQETAGDAEAKNTNDTGNSDECGVAPDIQTIGKGLGGGYQACSAILVGRRIARAMQQAGGAVFTHGHTYQNHPVASAAALAVQNIIQRDGLLANVRKRGAQLGQALHRLLDSHPHVGDVRGRGLFWAVEFVRDRTTKLPFAPTLRVANRIHDLALSPAYQLLVYHGQGCAGGGQGDHIMVMPAYNVTEADVATMADRLAAAIRDFFEVHGGLKHI